jgi:NADH dehydrogenase FAD-containing subunit
MSEDWEHPSPTHVPIKNKINKKKKYVIVGAGVAGRACLTQLIQSIQSIQSSSRDSNTYTNTCTYTYTAKDILLIDPNKDILDSINSNLSHQDQDQDQEVHVETTSLPISKFNIEEQKIEFASGDTVEFEKCLLSMGKETGRIGLDYISPTCSPSHVLHVEANSTENQLEQLRHLVMNNRHVTLLGGSWNSLFIAR